MTTGILAELTCTIPSTICPDNEYQLYDYFSNKLAPFVNNSLKSGIIEVCLFRRAHSDLQVIFLGNWNILRDLVFPHFEAHLLGAASVKSSATLKMEMAYPMLEFFPSIEHYEWFNAFRFFLGKQFLEEMQRSYLLKKEYQEDSFLIPIFHSVIVHFEKNGIPNTLLKSYSREMILKKDTSAPWRLMLNLFSQKLAMKDHWFNFIDQKEISELFMSYPKPQHCFAMRRQIEQKDILELAMACLMEICKISFSIHSDKMRTKVFDK